MYPFKRRDDIINNHFMWPKEHGLPQYERAISVASHMLDFEADRWTLDSIVDHDFFRDGTYPFSMTDTFGLVSPQTTSSDPHTFWNLCQAAGIGSEAQREMQYRQDRCTSINPVLTCSWDVVNPVPWKVRPCALVSADA